MKAHLVFSQGLDTYTYAFDINLAREEFPTGLVLSEFEQDKEGNTRVSPEILPTLTVSGMNNIVGRLLTIVDATNHDETVRTATKDLVKKELWGWYEALYDGAARTYHRDIQDNEE